MAGAKVVGGPAWRVPGVGSRGPRVVVCSWAHTLRGPLHAEFACRFEWARWPRASCSTLVPVETPKKRYLLQESRLSLKRNVTF